MGLFGFGRDKEIQRLKEQNAAQKVKIKQLKHLCKEKDSYFTEMISDGLRHGSSLAGKHMSDRKKWLNGKY